MQNLACTQRKSKKKIYLLLLQKKEAAHTKLYEKTPNSQLTVYLISTSSSLLVSSLISVDLLSTTASNSSFTLTLSSICFDSSSVSFSISFVASSFFCTNSSLSCVFYKKKIKMIIYSYSLTKSYAPLQFFELIVFALLLSV